MGRRNEVESHLVVYRSDGRLPEIADEVLEAEFSAFSRVFQLRLVPSPVIDPNVTESFVSDDHGTRKVATRNHSYFGSVAGESESTVRLTLVAGAMKGIVRIGGEIYFVEPARSSRPAAKAGDIVVYRASENPPPELPEDDVSDLEHTSANVLRSLSAADEEVLSGDESVSPVRGQDASNSAHITYDNDGQAPTDTFLRRLDMGLVADSRFYLVNHGGLTAQTPEEIEAAEWATFADMEAAVNTTDAIYRNTVNVTLRIVKQQILKTTAEETAAGIPHCPTICMSDPSPAPQVANPGTACLVNADCAVAGTSCQQAPSKSRRCSGGSNPGRACFTNLDCPGGSCGGSSTDTELCYGGTASGRLCQSNGCTAAGNCCTGSGSACQTLYQGPSRMTGRYRNQGSGPFTKSNTAVLHLFSGCLLYGGSATSRICGANGSSLSGSVSGHFQDIGGPASSAADGFFTFAHETGHNLMSSFSPHDNQDSCGAVVLEGDIFSTNLKILRRRCVSGPLVDEMCDDDDECAGIAGACQIPNERRCDLPPPFGTTVCARGSDCPSGLCLTTVSDRTCMGGTDDGKMCREFPTPDACPSGTCSGAPMSWNIYLMSSGILGGFSPCSKDFIADNLADFPMPSPPSAYDPTAACPPAFLRCHDVDHNGTVLAVDASLMLHMSVGLEAYDDLGDLGGVLPTGNPGPPDGVVTLAEAQYTLQVAVGAKPPAPACGFPEPAWIP